MERRTSYSPEDFIARLAALVPKPHAHLIRYHGVFAPASPDRARVVPKARVAAAGNHNECGETAPGDRRRRLTWAQRLKRVFAIGARPVPALSPARATAPSPPIPAAPKSR